MFALWLNCFCYNIRLRIKGVLSLESSPHLTDAETETWKLKLRVGNDLLRVIHAVSGGARIQTRVYSWQSPSAS